MVATLLEKLWARHLRPGSLMLLILLVGQGYLAATPAEQTDPVPAPTEKAAPECAEKADCTAKQKKQCKTPVEKKNSCDEPTASVNTLEDFFGVSGQPFQTVTGFGTALDNLKIEWYELDSEKDGNREDTHRYM